MKPQRTPNKNKLKFIDWLCCRMVGSVGVNDGRMLSHFRID